MMLVQHYKGSKEHYDANVHSGIYFATDTKEIILDGEAYLGNLQEQITENAHALLVLNGSGEGSIKQQLSLAINDFANKISDDGTVNTFKELIDYAANNTDAVGSLILKVATLENTANDHDGKLKQLNTDLVNTKDLLLMKLEADISETKQLIDDKITNAFEWEERSI